jgi:calcineurin-like phosphoesterase family protein
MLTGLMPAQQSKSAMKYLQGCLNHMLSKLSDTLSPDHTIVIEGDFQTSTKNKSSLLRVTNTLRHHILTTCGDNNIKYGSHKHVDPILCLCTGIKLIYIMSNIKMEKKPARGNGTVRNLM